MRLDQKSSLVSRTFERSSYPIDCFLQVVDFSTDFRSNRINPHQKYDHPRTLLIHGARVVIYHASKRVDSGSWINQVVARRNKNVAAVALANKNTRTVWAMLAHDRQFQSDYTPALAAA